MIVNEITWSHSSYSTYLLCPRKFAFQYLEGLRQKSEKVADETDRGANIGSIIHECIDKLYQGQDWQSHFNSMIVPDSKLAQIPGDKSGSVSHIKTIIEKYIGHYKAPKDIDFQVSETEKEYSMSLTPWLTFRGIIDKVAIERSSGDLIIVDHKSSKSLKSYIEPYIDIEDQFTGYIALAQANGFNCDKIIVDGISTAKNALDDPGKLFVRYHAIRTKEQIDEWKARVIEAATRLKRDIETSTFITGDRKAACMAFFSPCPYYNVCAAGGSARQNILRNGYEVSPDKGKNFKLGTGDDE